VTTTSPNGIRVAALLLAAMLLALTAAWATPAPAYACSCAESSEAELTAQADVIFTGTVGDDQIDEGTKTRTLFFTVDRVYKGRATRTQVVATASAGGSCGLEIRGAGPFLVFADAKQAGLTADLCGGTRAGPAPAGLGPGRAPLADPTPSADPAAADPLRGRWVPLVGIILAVSAGAVVALSLRRSASDRES
jgi:hypothetical protein